MPELVLLFCFFFVVAACAKWYFVRDGVEEWKGCALVRRDNIWKFNIGRGDSYTTNFFTGFRFYSSMGASVKLVLLRLHVHDMKLDRCFFFVTARVLCDEGRQVLIFRIKKIYFIELNVSATARFLHFVILMSSLLHARQITHIREN